MFIRPHDFQYGIQCSVHVHISNHFAPLSMERKINDITQIEFFDIVNRLDGNTTRVSWMFQMWERFVFLRSNGLEYDLSVGYTYQQIADEHCMSRVIVKDILEVLKSGGYV